MRFRSGELEDRGLEIDALWSAPNADALHQVLVLAPSYGRSADAHEPFALLQKHHSAEPGTSVSTASLLLTDRRWRNGVGRLVRRIADSSILDQEQLDLLARTFLAADEAVYWEIPDAWFSGEEIVITLNGKDTDEDEDEGLGDDDEPPGAPARTVARRHVAPPLRRWAAGHVVTRDPCSWGGVLARARQLDPRGAAAVMAGLLDAIEVLVPTAQAILVTAATTWPHQGVRRSAVDLVARRDGVAAARRLAQDDPSAGVRAWSEAIVAPGGETAGKPASSPGPERPRDRLIQGTGQPTLF